MIKRWGFSDQRGEANPFMISTIVLVVIILGVGAGFAWAYMQMVDYRDNVSEKVAVAVKAGKKEQKVADDARFVEDYKKPNYTFQGPADYGSLSFDYPKTWSVYVAKNANDGGDFAVYFHPSQVPTVANGTPFALRVIIVNKSYDDVLKAYASKIKKGDLSAKTITLAKTDDFSGYEGMRIDGQFDKTINGSAVFFKVRDKTIQVFVDSQDFMADYEKTVLTTLKYES